MASREQGRRAPLTHDHEFENDVTEITSVATQPAYLNIAGAESYEGLTRGTAAALNPYPPPDHQRVDAATDQARMDAVMIRATTAVFRRAARRSGPWAAGDIGELLRSLARALFDPYRPELHYMRGPGPKWHAKYDRPIQTEAAVAALPLTPTHPANALAAPVLIRCA
jgi:hypothetical protein